MADGVNLSLYAGGFSLTFTSKAAEAEFSAALLRNGRPKALPYEPDRTGWTIDVKDDE